MLFDSPKLVLYGPACWAIQIEKDHLEMEIGLNSKFLFFLKLFPQYILHNGH